MEETQVYSSAHHSLCQNLVKNVSFHLLTEPYNWRNTRDEDWTIGKATNFDQFMDENTKYLYKQLLSKENAENFNLKETEDNEDEYYEAELELFSIFQEMFPTIYCLHGDDQDNIKDKFLPELRKLYAIFHE